MYRLQSMAFKGTVDGEVELQRIGKHGLPFKAFRVRGDLRLDARFGLLNASAPRTLGRRRRPSGSGPGDAGGKPSGC